MSESARGTRPVVCIGPMPPPVHGAALMMHAAVRQISKILPCEVIDLSPGTLRRSIPYHATRIARHVHAGHRLMQLKRTSTVFYISVPGGLGQVYLLLLSPLIRNAASAIFLHHHNYTYVRRPTTLARMLFRILDRDTTHVTLCDEMTSRLRAAYPNLSAAVSLPNVWALAESDPDTRSTPAGAPLHLSHISNLSAEKGLQRVTDLFRELPSDLNVCLNLAGSFANNEARRIVKRACEEFGERVQYWGHVTGETKARLFSKTDVFVFPSANDAAPLVVDEALAAGALVVCFPVGCLAEFRLRTPAVALADPGDGPGLVRAVTHALEYCELDRAAAASDARELFQERQRVAAVRLEDLLARLRSKCAIAV